MEDFFNTLGRISNRQQLKKKIEKGRQLLKEQEGEDQFTFAFKLSRWAKLYHSSAFAVMVIDDVIDQAKNNPASEAAAILLGQKAYWSFANGFMADASYYADLALKSSRDIKSDQAETKALIIKGYICDVRKEHQKTSAWYTIALTKCTALQKPGLLLDLGTSLSKQGAYKEAWGYIQQALSAAKTIIKDSSCDVVERTNQKRIIAEVYSRIAVVYEGIGDFDAALRAYDESLVWSTANGFSQEIYKAYSRKMRLFIMIEDFDEAVKTLQEAEKLVYEGKDIEARARLYLKHDWARLYKSTKRYEKAFQMYKEILSGEISNGRNDTDYLNHLMDYQADILSEMLGGIAACLRAERRIVDADDIENEESRFSELKRQAGIYNEIDKPYKLDIQKKRIQACLKRIFLNEPDFVEYRNIQAKYYDKGEDSFAVFEVNGEMVKRTKSDRFFLVFKCLVDNAGKRVSERDLAKFAIAHGLKIDEENSALRVQVGRLSNQLNLSQFIKRCYGREKGWILKKP